MSFIKFVKTLTKNKMKTRLSILIFAILFAFDIYGQDTENTVIETILSGYTAREFTSETISDQDIDLILKCGMKAPSARNSQLWRFTVIRNETLISQIMRDPVPENIVIIVSGAEAIQEGIDVDFDCALATENMFIAAHSLGLGAHIYTGPIRSINSKKQEFSIPTGYRAIAVLRIGHVNDNVDAVSSATIRKKKEDIVNFVK